MTGAVGGDTSFDHGRLLEEIESEARTLRESGAIPPELQEQLDHLFETLVPDESGERDFASALDRVERDSLIDVHPPVESRIPAGAPVKRAVRRLVLWYMDFVAGQLTTLAGSLSRALRLLGNDVEDLDSKVGDLDRRVSALSDEVRGRSLHLLATAESPEAWRPWAPSIIELASAIPGRVLHAECDTGDLVADLVAAGVDAYAVGPAPGVHRHLEDVADGDLGAVVLSGVVDRARVPDLVTLVDECARVLADGGLLLLVATRPEAWEASVGVVRADLAPGRPLHPETWQVLVSRGGFTAVEAREGDGASGETVLLSGRRGRPVTGAD